MNDSTSLPASSYTKKISGKHAPNYTPATVAKFDGNTINVNPSETVAKVYTKKEAGKKNYASKARKGSMNTSGLEGVVPSETPAKSYVKGGK